MYPDGIAKGESDMGTYLNPGKIGFAKISKGEYVDKTGLIRLMNEKIDGPNSLVCISRPRRFGKSYAAKMLCAYYDFTCDSNDLFQDKEIASAESYERHLNKYHVISLDITGFISKLKSGEPLSSVPDKIVSALHDELVSLYPDFSGAKDLSECLIQCVRKTGRQFVFVIDEWDALIREAKDDKKTQDAYLRLLRGWFKNNNFTPEVIAAAYMTGILPIKKDGSQSAISDFAEYPILDPGKFAEYTGFTLNEVRCLCVKHGMSFEKARSWYDGYDFPEVGPIYNPYSIMEAIDKGRFASYWKKTSAAESLLTYINMDFDGLQQITARLISGEEISVDIERFQNDFETFRSKDDILTLLIHLGYLTYNQEKKSARIPNEEVRLEFDEILTSRNISRKWVELLRDSQKLLSDTINGDEAAVAKGIEAVRKKEYAPTFYNDKQALRYVIKFAYIACIGQYAKIEELPSGRGIADVVYIPKKFSHLPALLIELKWNTTAAAAVSQIEENDYPAVLKELEGEILLVGIGYYERTKEHTCRIKKVEGKR